LITVGIFARVTVVLSCCGALLLGLLGAVSAGRLDNERRLARAQIAASVVLLVGLGIATAYRLVDWAKSWEVQQEVLRQFPHDLQSLVSLCRAARPARCPDCDRAMGDSGHHRLCDVAGLAGRRATFYG
jgi:hypothetical protein